jgi:hypothetical protein
MTAQEAIQLIGRTGTIALGGLQVGVTVQDVKVSYGRTRYLVAPLAGSKGVWVESVALDAFNGGGAL